MSGFKSKRLLSKGRAIDSSVRPDPALRLVSEIIQLRRENLRLVQELEQVEGDKAHDGTSGKAEGRR